MCQTDMFDLCVRGGVKETLETAPRSRKVPHCVIMSQEPQSQLHPAAIILAIQISSISLAADVLKHAASPEIATSFCLLFRSVVFLLFVLQGNHCFLATRRKLIRLSLSLLFSQSDAFLLDVRAIGSSLRCLSFGNQWPSLSYSEAQSVVHKQKVSPLTAGT